MDTYEEKYKKALEKARQLYAYPTTKPFTSDLQDIFPELKESEDERIRKSLIDMLKNDEKCYLKEIAWLEKQNTPAKLSEEEQNRFVKGILTSCAMSFIDYLDAHKYEGKMCVSNGECEDIENAFHNAMWDKLHIYYGKYIEKQGEKPQCKSALEAAKEEKVDNANKVESKFKVGDWLCDDTMRILFRVDEVLSDMYRLTDNTGKIYYKPKAEVEAVCRKFDVLKDAEKKEPKKIEQKPADKVEPKFKVGDWVVNELGDVWHIDSFDKKNYQVSNGNEYNYFPISMQNEMHLWNIADAKDGDVLSYVTDKEDLWIMIYRSLYEPYEGHVHYHALLVNDEFTDKGTCCICIDNLEPATKEQREQLEKAMADAGYVWLSGKKELKKIEEKTTCKLSDEHYELEEFAKIVRCNLTGISKSVQQLFEAKYLQLTGNKMYEGFKD